MLLHELLWWQGLHIAEACGYFYTGPMTSIIAANPPVLAIMLTDTEFTVAFDGMDDASIVHVAFLWK